MKKIKLNTKSSSDMRKEPVRLSSRSKQVASSRVQPVRDSKINFSQTHQGLQFGADFNRM